MPDINQTAISGQVKISELPVAPGATGTDQLEANQAGVSRSITVAQIAALSPPPDLTDYVTDEELATAIATIPPTNWASIPGKPLTFPPTLPIPESGVTNLVGDLAAKAPLASPGLTGVPTAPTAAQNTDTTQLATCAFVNLELGGQLAFFAPINSPLFTGDPKAPSPAAGDADTSIPTTAWVQGELAAIAPGGATLTGYWNYNSAALVPPPANGRVRLSVAWPPTLSSSMHLYIASTDVDGYSYTWALGPAVNNILVFRSASGGRAQLLVTAVSIQSGYIDVTATVQQVSGNNVNNSRCQISILANSYSPSGAAGGDLAGSYPNPTIKPSVTNGQVMTTVAGVAAWAAASGGALLQTVSFETGAVATGTTPMPIDDTIPQITEGDQYMSLSITPKSATSKLIIEVVWNGATNINGTVGVALFQDATANALAAAAFYPSPTSTMFCLAFRHAMTSGTTSPTTFRVRAGAQSAGTTTFNGSVGARVLGGVMASSIVITELSP